MKTYEIRYTETIVKVYRIEARNAEEAAEKHSYDESILVQEYPISDDGPYIEEAEV